MALAYHEELDKKNTLKLRELQKDLPPFCNAFFRGIDQITASRTKIAYAYDLKVFFTNLMEELKLHDSIEQFTVSDVENCSIPELEEYMEYLKYRTKKKKNADGEMETVDILNHNKSIKRKISSLKSFYNYLYKAGLISSNKASLLSLPKLSQEEIIRMDQGEIAEFLDEVENGNQLSKKEREFHEKNNVRDLAMMQLMLGTGIRVSECVGLNLSDLDFNNNGIRIHRKGGKNVTIYFSDEVESGLRAYLEERKLKIPASGHEEALFLSIQNKRISVRSVEKMVKKYAGRVTPLKHITPHKLRSSYGTNLYQETGDIYLVADVLGHSDVNTTKKHYAALEEERRRSVRNVVRLRKEEGES